MSFAPVIFARPRNEYVERFGDPSTWSGDWRRCPNGRYLRDRQQAQVSAQLRTHEQLIIALAIRQVPSRQIGALFGVSRESIDRRLRPHALKNEPGQVGRPPSRR
ncbi:MAG TPA: hypothetical protein VHF69_00545 [Candidatus Synoicihabitans sp.]|nr:hypothetical protein [Candidatus Synoicihabitans sp.]